MCPAITLPPEDHPMRAVILLSTLCLTGFAAAAATATAVAQQPPAQPKPKPAAQQQRAQQKPAAPPAAASPKLTIAGTWAMENTVKTTAGKDTVVKSLLTATADANGWVTHLAGRDPIPTRVVAMGDRKSTRLNSSHLVISYAVFCLKKKKKIDTTQNAGR